MFCSDASIGVYAKVFAGKFCSMVFDFACVYRCESEKNKFL